MGRGPEKVISGPVTTVSTLFFTCHCTPEGSHRNASAESPGEDEAVRETREHLGDRPLTQQGLREPASHLIPELQWSPQGQHSTLEGALYGESDIEGGLSVPLTSFYFKNPTEERNQGKSPPCRTDHGKAMGTRA